jgi:hypothetical protein
MCIDVPDAMFFHQNRDAGVEHRISGKVREILPESGSQFLMTICFG